MDSGKPSARQAACLFVEERFPACDGALLGGSVVRGEGTDRSDLDIIVFEERVPSAYRQSILFKGWPVELFVHNQESYLHFTEQDCKRARPSLPMMVAEGLVLKGEIYLKAFKEDAEDRLAAGPERWSEETIRTKRYFLTDVLDDFKGSMDMGEDLMIAGDLAVKLHEFFLRTNGQWIGESKWIIRALKRFDPAFAQEFVRAFDAFYAQQKKESIIKLVEKVLEPFGGLLFEGYSAGKK
ncbi:nucleotidyltransferase domain-containing protein [Bacillus testis]|uniref:nucleotidyltransferase domain-containing protein n=1 Tax=Bacillus testis TaxID=1622072 RepID=UPI00067EC74E|nr:nucleotidyltransferase domain-containing protein [Bacillus testis]